MVKHVPAEYDGDSRHFECAGVHVQGGGESGLGAVCTSIFRALRASKGRGSGPVEATTLPCTLTANSPLVGLLVLSMQSKPLWSKTLLDTDMNTAKEI